jgi:rSAM/selenodomain-associated transferase 1
MPFSAHTVPTYYRRHFRRGMADLSSSSAPAAGLLFAPGSADTAYAPPGGLPALRDAIAARYDGLAPGDVIVTTGASEALAALALAVTQAGDTVVATRGCYPSLAAVAERGGARVVETPGADPARLVAWTNPRVPTGEIVDSGRWIAEALQRDAIPVADEVYLDLVLEGDRVSPAATLDPRAVSIGDLSKPLGLGGLRIGWLATRNRAVLDAVCDASQLLTGGPSTLSMLAAVSALASFDVTVARTLACARERGTALIRFLRTCGWEAELPAAGLALLATAPYPIEEETLAALRADGLFLLPGSVFGAPSTSVRLSLFAPVPQVATAIRLLEQASRMPTALPPGTLVVLAKAPLPGVAKTRLAARVGAAATAALARAFLDDTLTVAASGAWRTILAFDPPSAEPLFRDAAAPGARLIPQCQGDLGARIHDALTTALVSGDRAVLIGSDTPDLPPRIVEEAFDALGCHDLVLGPATDGGFYLIGCNAVPAALFDDVAWSTDTVCDQVLANARRLNLRVCLLEPWSDVDEADDLGALWRRIAASGMPPATYRVLRELDGGRDRGT